MNPILDDPAPGAATWPELLLDAMRAATHAASAEALAEIVEELLLDAVGDRAGCLFHDLSDGTVGSATDPARAGEVPRGIAGAAIRSGSPLLVLRADRDARFVAAIDDPRGDGRAKLVAHPVGRPPEVHAVLVVARGAERPPFSADDLERVATVAYHLGPVLEAFALREALASAAADTRGPYRREAIEARRTDVEEGGLLLPVSPWVRRVYVFLAVVCGLAAPAAGVVRIAEHASGPCVVQLGPATEVRAVVGGPVANVHVRPGDAVRAGQPLVEVADADADAALERLVLEQELQLRNLLRDPADRAARQAVVAGRTERALLEARKASRSVRAPAAGVVRQLWVGAGQRVDVGETVATVALPGGVGAHAVALLPAEALPAVRAGAAITLRVDGSASVHLAKVVPPLPDGVLPPGAARRLLGARAAELPAERGVVVVHADLSAPAPILGDGVAGTAELELRSVPLWVAAIPGMETLW